MILVEIEEWGGADEVEGWGGGGVGTGRGPPSLSVIVEGPATGGGGGGAARGGSSVRLMIGVVEVEATGPPREVDLIFIRLALGSGFEVAEGGRVPGRGSDAKGGSGGVLSFQSFCMCD